MDTVHLLPTEVLVYIEQNWLRFIFRIPKKSNKYDLAFSGQCWRGCREMLTA